MASEARRSDAPSDAVELACFELEGQTYGVAIGHVREILPTPTITPLPDAPALIEGLFDLRGAWVPVVDLGGVLAREREPGGSRGRLVVASARDLLIGFRVDRATRVMAISRADFEAVPELMQALGCRLVPAAVRRPDHAPILVLDLEVLVSGVLGAAKAGPGREEVAA